MGEVDTTSPLKKSWASFTNGHKTGDMTVLTHVAIRTAGWCTQMTTKLIVFWKVSNVYNYTSHKHSLPISESTVFFPFLSTLKGSKSRKMHAHDENTHIQSCFPLHASADANTVRALRHFGLSGQGARRTPSIGFPASSTTWLEEGCGKIMLGVWAPGCWTCSGDIGLIGFKSPLPSKRCG